MEDTLLNFGNYDEFQEKQTFKIYTLGILSSISIVMFFTLLFFGSLFFYFPFLGALIFAIVGLVISSKLKPRSNKIYTKTDSRLTLAKFLLWFTIVIITAVILLTVGFLILVGTGGFGR